MMGRLTFPFRQRTAEAVLHEDGRWACPEIPTLVRVLDTLYAPERSGEAVDAARVRCQLDAAARWLKATVEHGSHDARN